MIRPLAPDELFPADSANVTSRVIALSTGISVRVAESGPRDGVPAVLLHGWGGSLYMYRHGLERLGAFGIRSVAVDLRGFGLSDKPRHRGAYTLDAHCADLDALLDSLALRRAALVGQSMGGALALRYAQRKPERVTSLALINPIGLVPVIYPALLSRVPRFFARAIARQSIPRSLIAFTLRRVAYGNASLVTERDVDEYWATARLPGYVYAADACLREFEWRPLTSGEAKSLAPPAVVILGTTDRLVRRANAAAARLRCSTVHDVVGGHCVHEERPDVVYEIIGRHVR